MTLLKIHPVPIGIPKGRDSLRGSSGIFFTCDIFFDLLNLADGVVASEHVQVEGLGVFTNTCPCADVRSCPPL